MITKDAAGYQVSLGGQCCGTCVMFRNGSCDLVMGMIETYAICDYWEYNPGDIMSVAEHVARNGVDSVQA